MKNKIMLADLQFVDQADVHIVGLDRKDSGRSCQAHPQGCGLTLQLDEIVKFESSTYEIDNQTLPCVKVRRMKDWTPTCT